MQDELFNRRPDFRIFLHLEMRSKEGAACPTLFAFVDLFASVVVLKVAENCGARGILSSNLGLTANGPRFALKEVCGYRHVGGYEPIISTDAIHMQAQCDRNTQLVQFLI